MSNFLAFSENLPGMRVVHNLILLKHTCPSQLAFRIPHIYSMLLACIVVNSVNPDQAS